MHTLINDKQVIARMAKLEIRFYELRPQVNYNKTIPINNKFSIQLVISKYILPNIVSLPKNLVEIIQFSITISFKQYFRSFKSNKIIFEVIFDI